MRRKNLFLLVATLFTVLFIGSSKVSADQFRVGMEQHMPLLTGHNMMTATVLFLLMV
ncbi:hypothetical protein N568_0107155 [Lactococcus garvieae TRF1]|uniref:Uncharacterized protein n=1 Tax=Lactococcus garvieae TRF1 TaxID=1380772 RepID=V8AR03_9LACT|nr:hypothetical protein N568_0107155 [Lactococcus garvieae TRF1]